MQFSQSKYERTILENEAPGSDVVQLSVNAQNVEYFVTRVTSAGVMQPAYFSVSDDGWVKTAMPLDRDQNFVTYVVEVYARDRSSDAPRTTRAEVNIVLIIPSFFVAVCQAIIRVNLTTGGDNLTRRQ